MIYKKPMNKTKNKIIANHQIFIGKIIKIISCEVQTWTDDSYSPTSFEFIVENNIGKQITVTGSFKEICIHENQEVLLIIAPCSRKLEVFNLLVLIDLKLDLLWRTFGLDSGSNIIKKKVFSHFIMISKLFIILTILYAFLTEFDFYTITIYPSIVIMIVFWKIILGHESYHEAIYFNAIFEMLGFNNAANLEISEFSLEKLKVKVDDNLPTHLLNETFSLKAMFQTSEKIGYSNQKLRKLGN